MVVFKVKNRWKYMEFSSRGFQRNTTRPTAPTSVGNTSTPDNPKKPIHKRAAHHIKSNTVLSLILFVSAVILVVAVILGISTKSSENSVVQKNRYQAVFLNGGQAYFGKIKALNDRFIDLGDVYYISTNGQNDKSSQANISLIKLGSELHCPQDRMVINREQVLFWENLNDDGKVVNAIKQWKKENPNGQKCNNQTTQQQTPAQTQDSGETNDNGDSSSNSSTQGANGPTTPSTGTDSNTNPNTSSTSPSTGNDNPTSNTPPTTP
jgi:hypothetical protein